MTRVVDDLTAWQHERRRQIREGVTLGLVPTMGALHEGHLSLVRRSRADNDQTLVSIFVNPQQFDEESDFAHYPRTLERDLNLLDTHGVDVVLAPTPAQMYPDGFRYRVSENQLSRELEGACRPGHFEGVLTVVLKLLHLAAAERAYFGEKDWQQLTLIQGMVDAFFLPTRIVGCETVRDADGLALSSRNHRLGAAERQKAAAFPRILSTSPTSDVAARALHDAGFAVDYVEDRADRRLGAVRLGGVRLIDNVPLRGLS